VKRAPFWVAFNEYFLGGFAGSEGKRGGEFYTPRSVVRVLVEMLEPFPDKKRGVEGRVYDAAITRRSVARLTFWSSPNRGAIHQHDLNLPVRRTRRPKWNRREQGSPGSSSETGSPLTCTGRKTGAGSARQPRSTSGYARAPLKPSR
jgi:hypothetical protein